MKKWGETNKKHAHKDLTLKLFTQQNLKTDSIITIGRSVCMYLLGCVGEASYMGENSANFPMEMSKRDAGKNCMGFHR